MEKGHFLTIQAFHASQMELSMQLISIEKSVRNDTIRDLKHFNTKSLTTQAKKAEQLDSMMPNKTFRFFGWWYGRII